MGGKFEVVRNLTTLYAVIWGQCSNAMRNKLRALDDFVSENQKNNCIWLLKEIKGVTHKFDTKRHVVMSLLDARVAFYNCHQTQNQTNADYLATFQSNVQVLEYYKATVGENYIHADASKSVTERTKIMRDSTIAIMFIRNSDPAGTVPFYPTLPINIRVVMISILLTLPLRTVFWSTTFHRPQRHVHKRKTTRQPTSTPM
jgi:hypothetical protein